MSLRVCLKDQLLQSPVPVNHPTSQNMSVNGIGALDLISRAATLEGLNFAEQPFLRASILVLRFLNWEDDGGVTHTATQGEGREQGDVLMPVPYSLGQHGALQSVASHLLPGQRLFAFLDDVYVVCALPSCTASCVLPCGISHVFESAPGRRSCGIEQGWSPLGASISQLRHVWQAPQLVSGREQKILPNISARFAFLTHRWATQSSWSHSSRRRLSPTAHASSGSHAEPLALVAVLWNVESQQQPQNRSSVVVTECFARQHDAGIWQCLCTLFDQVPDELQPECANEYGRTLPS